MRYVARILAADASLAGPPYDRRPPSSYSRRRRISSLARKFTFPIYPANPSSPSSPSSIPTTIFFFHPPARAPRGAESGDQQSFSRTSAQRRVIPPFVLLRVFLTTVHKRFGNSQESRSCADRCGLLLSCRRNHPTQPVTAILIYRDRLGDRKKIPRVLRSSFRKSSVSRQGCSVNS